MADIRSLLKAKREETRIAHPYATYTPSSQLKCTICNLLIKHASAWEGHLGSKAHRTAVARVRQMELEAAAAAASLNDRDDDHDEDVDEGGDMEVGGKASTRAKRKASVSGEEDLEAKKRRTAAAASSGASGGFPADFFSDPTRTLPQPDDDDDQDEDSVGGKGEDAMVVDSTPIGASTQSKTVVDEEYERFQRELLAMQTAEAPAVSKHETFARATVAGEEELFTEQQKSGFDGIAMGGDGAAGEDAAQEEETAQQKRERLEREERELIMDRLLEEERLQEDADMRVAATKARVEALKKKREQRKAEKAAAQGAKP